MMSGSHIIIGKLLNTFEALSISLYRKKRGGGAKTLERGGAGQNRGWEGVTKRGETA